MNRNLTILSDVPDEPVEYLWEGRIPLGEITVIEGHPATNKSSLTAALAAPLTQGLALPGVDAAQRHLNGGALFLIGEDSIGKTVKARLEAAGADLKRIGVLETVSIPGDMHTLEKAIIDIGAKLVVVDTLSDFLDCNVMGNKAVRNALRPLRDLAGKQNIAVVLLRHFIKNSSGHSLLRGGGSVGITAVARSQMKMLKHPEDANLRVLIHDKNNLGPPSTSLLFEIVPYGQSIRLECVGETSLTIEDLEKKGGRPKSDAAEKFLLDNLATGPKEVNWLIEAARGICSKRTLDEAKRSLGIETIREGKGKDHKVYWKLKDYTPPPKASELKARATQTNDFSEEELDVPPTPTPVPKPKAAKKKPSTRFTDQALCDTILQVVSDFTSSEGQNQASLDLAAIVERVYAVGYRPTKTTELRLEFARCLNYLTEEKRITSENGRYGTKNMSTCSVIQSVSSAKGTNSLQNADCKERYATMSEIGKLYFQSSHVIGRWLTRCGLRKGGQPTETATTDGYCKQIYDEDRGIFFWIWHFQRTTAAIENLIDDCISTPADTPAKDVLNEKCGL